MKKLFVVAIILLFSIVFYANDHYGLLSLAGLNGKGLPAKMVKGNLASTPQTGKSIVDHSKWTQLLQKYVNDNGVVNYSGLIKDKNQLQHYLNTLTDQVPTNDWAVQEQLAYYINLYNAYTVELIIENYPIESIKDIKGAWTQNIVKIGDKQISLGGLEHSILRKMNEPRIHFAINCASVSCPKLLNEAFTPDNLEQQLEKVTYEFINSDKNTITPNKIALSRIFKWYKGDFAQRDLAAFINKYSKIKILPETKIEYKKYNWSLNETQ